MAELLLKWIQISKNGTDVLQCLESIKNAFDILRGIPDVILKSIKPVVDQLRLEAANISLRYEHERLSSDLNKIGYDVVELIDTLESICKMTDDKNRKQRIFAEVENQRKVGTSHLYRKDITRFPEFNDFLTELITRIDTARTLSQTVEEECKELSTRIQAAETQASNKENVAKWMKLASTAVAVSICIAAGGVGLAVIAGKGAVILGALCIGGGGGSGILSVKAYKNYSHEEEEFRSKKKEFKSLNDAAHDLRIIAREGIFPTRKVGTHILASLTHENMPDQPPSVEQITTSLESMFIALEIKTDFGALREKAEGVVSSTKNYCK